MGNASYEKLQVDNWENRARSWTLLFAGLIPKSGWLVQGAIELFWEANKTTVWDLIKKQTSALIDKKIKEHEKRELRAKIKTLKHMMSYYFKANIKNRASKMDNAIHAAVSARDYFQECENRHFMIPYGIIIAYLHVTLLRELYENGAQYFPVDEKNKWKKQMIAAVRDYHDIIREVALQHQRWQHQNFVLSYTTEWGGLFGLGGVEVGKLRDNLKNKEFIIREDSKGQNVQLSEIKRRLKTLRESLRAQADAELGGLISPIWELKQLLPKPEAVKQDCLPGLKTTTIGPFSSSLTGVHPTAPTKTTDHDFGEHKGAIKQVNMRWGQVVDCLQFEYNKKKGDVMGNNQTGSSAKKYPVKAGINEVNLRFYDNGIQTFDFSCIDGKKGGNRGKSQPTISIKLSPSLNLVSTDYATGYFYGRLCLGAVSFKFAYNPESINKLCAPIYKKELKKLNVPLK